MILMHKNDPVAEIDFVGTIPYKFGKIYNNNLLPLGTDVLSYKQSSYLHDWYLSRSIPNGRCNKQKLEEKLGYSVSEGFLRSKGVSLTDCYWLKENENENIAWEDVNYHRNGFDPVFAEAIGGIKCDGVSPDFTTDGVLEKMWVSSLKIPYLLKTADANKMRVIANEIVVSETASLLGINSVRYDKSSFLGRNYCRCRCFVSDENTDYYPIQAVTHSLSQGTDVDALRLLKEKNTNIEKGIADLKMLDVLFCQEDRHNKNVGILISGDDTILAPIFDSGNCLGGVGKKFVPLYDNHKLFRKTIDELADEVDKVDIPEKEVRMILKKTYEDFGIHEEDFCVANEYLSYGMSLLQDKDLIR